MDTCMDVVGNILGGSIRYSWTKRKTWAQGSEALVKGIFTTAYSFISGLDADQETKFSNHRVVLGRILTQKETCSQYVFVQGERCNTGLIDKFTLYGLITVNDSIVLYYLFLYIYSANRGYFLKNAHEFGHISRI